MFVQFKPSSGTELKKIFQQSECLNATFDGTGQTEQDERLDYSDKSQPIREHDCTQCMACQEACPEKAILIEPSYQEYHEKADGTFVKWKVVLSIHTHTIKSFFLFLLFLQFNFALLVAAS